MRIKAKVEARPKPNPTPAVKQDVPLVHVAVSGLLLQHLSPEDAFSIRQHIEKFERSLDVIVEASLASMESRYAMFPGLTRRQVKSLIASKGLDPEAPSNIPDKDSIRDVIKRTRESGPVVDVIPDAGVLNG